MSERLVTWTGVDDASRVDLAAIELGDDSMRAIGSSRSSWFASAWELDVAPGWITRRLVVTTHGFGWSRSLELARSETGVWTADASHSGTSDLPAPGIAADTDLTLAVDCDLGLCPVTNTMPIRRLGLLGGTVAETHLVMAWVDMPSLQVIRSDQVYASEPPADGERRVHYQSFSRDFSAHLSVDDEGLVIDYPGLASRA